MLLLSIHSLVLAYPYARLVAAQCLEVCSVQVFGAVRYPSTGRESTKGPKGLKMSCADAIQT